MIKKLMFSLCLYLFISLKFVHTFRFYIQLFSKTFTVVTSKLSIMFQLSACIDSFFI